MTGHLGLSPDLPGHGTQGIPECGTRGYVCAHTGVCLCRGASACVQTSLDADVYGEPSWVYTGPCRACLGKMGSSSIEATQGKGLSCNLMHLNRPSVGASCVVADGGSESPLPRAVHPFIQPFSPIVYITNALWKLQIHWPLYSRC